MKYLLTWFKRHKSSNDPKAGLPTEFFLDAYNARKKEIESLRKYDRGEKTITPSNLRDIVRNI